MALPLQAAGQRPAHRMRLPAGRGDQLGEARPLGPGEQGDDLLELRGRGDGAGAGGAGRLAAAAAARLRRRSAGLRVGHGRLLGHRGEPVPPLPGRARTPGVEQQRSVAARKSKLEPALLQPRDAALPYDVAQLCVAGPRMTVASLRPPARRQLPADRQPHPRPAQRAHPSRSGRSSRSPPRSARSASPTRS